MDAVILTCDDLIFRLFVRPLEDKVAECPGKCQIAVDPIELHPAAAIDDPLGLRLVVGLVVERQDLQLSVHAGNGSRIPCIRAVQLAVFHQDYNGRGAGHLVAP